MTPELSIVIPVQNESPNIKPLYDELTQTLGQYGRSYELLIVDDGSTDDTFDAARGPAGARSAAARHPLSPQLRSDRGVCRRLRARARPPGRDRPTATCRTIPRDIPRWSPSSNRATTSSAAGGRTGRTRSSPRRVPSMLANKLISWATGVRAARLRLLAEGVPRRGREAAAPLRRDASLPAGDCQPDRRADRRRWWSTTGAARRRLEVRALAHGPRRPRSRDGQVPPELLDAAAADLRPARLACRRPRHADHRLSRLRPARSSIRRSPIGRCCCSA